MIRTAPGGRVSCLAFAPDSRSLASGHADGTILVWDPKKGREPKGRPERKADAGQRERADDHAVERTDPEVVARQGEQSRGGGAGAERGEPANLGKKCDCRRHGRII